MLLCRVCFFCVGVVRCCFRLVLLFMGVVLFIKVLVVIVVMWLFLFCCFGVW